MAGTRMRMPCFGGFIFFMELCLEKTHKQRASTQPKHHSSSKQVFRRTSVCSSEASYRCNEPVKCHAPRSLV